MDIASTECMYSADDVSECLTVSVVMYAGNDVAVVETAVVCYDGYLCTLDAPVFVR